MLNVSNIHFQEIIHHLNYYFFNYVEPCQGKLCQHLFNKNLKYLRYPFLQFVCSVNLVALFIFLSKKENSLKASMIGWSYLLRYFCRGNFWFKSCIGGSHCQIILRCLLSFAVSQQELKKIISSDLHNWLI